MRELLENRRHAAIAVVIGVIVTIAAVMHVTGGSSGTPAHARPKPATHSLLAGAPGGDAAAETVLQSGATAMESWFTEHGDFAGAATGIATVEPNLGWVTGGPAQAAANQVSVVVAAGNAGYTLTTTSITGAVYVYARDATAHTTKTCGPGCTW